MAKLDKLPGWVTSNEESVRREAEPYRHMTPAQRLALGARASRSALAVVMQSPHRDVALTYRDPLPITSQQAMARLRAEYRAARR
jgi:hypothetical protein